MDHATLQRVLDAITSFYRGSDDFNGVPVTALQSRCAITQDHVSGALRQLVRAGAVTLVFGDAHPNPHIKAFPDEPPDAVLEKLSSPLAQHACAYPTRKHLEAIVPRSDYADMPYTLELALGEPQLAFRAFDLAVLEYYRNDPRYSYEHDDIQGSISIHDEYFESQETLDRDKCSLQTFGFCYDTQMNRAVAVFLRNLHDLSPEHQQRWRVSQLDGDYTLHPDYYRTSILADWGTRLPILSAFLMEQDLVNRMCTAMGRPHLFRQTHDDRTRPRSFFLLIRPTLAEFEEFVHTLDKLIADNIDKSFFQNEVPDTQEQRRGNRVVPVERGTLAMLEDWVKSKFRVADPAPLDSMVAIFKEVRKMRAPRAHRIQTDEFDQRYFQDQRELIIRAYDGVRTLRLLLANHPAVRRANLPVNELLEKGEIWTF
jgi:hypothetical protein